MIRLHVLGAVRVAGDALPERRRPLSQPRRVALLAYLALRAPHGPERRDRLLSLFWPESDANHARGALRNALHFLRTRLGPDVIRSMGTEEVHLDLARLWCDAVAFDRLCEAGDAVGALQVYGGDLLEGFHVSDAPGFEHWLDRERARLRHRASEAARDAAESAAAEGEPGLAVQRLRQLLELEPTNEAAARRLMRLLADGDDRGQALRLFTGLESHLDEEYGLEPAPETRALAYAIRAGGAAEEADPRAAGGAGGAGGAIGMATRAGPATSGGEAPGEAERSTSRTQARPARGVRRPRRAAQVSVAAGTLALVLISAAVLLGYGGRDAGSADVVAVLPFAYRGAPEHDYLGEGLADLLAANLDGAGDLRSVDPRALLVSVQPLDGPLDAGAARRAASAHGAGLFVLGSVTEAGGQLRVTASLHGPTAGPAPAGGGAAVVVEGSADDLLELVDRVSLALLEGRGATVPALAAIRTTSSVEALKSFLRGEAALRRGDVHGAIDHYRTATEVDSTFALAYYRLSSAAYRGGISRVPTPAAEAALRHAGRLVREDSLLVAAWHHHVTGSVTEALRLYQEALVLRPGHVEARFQLGELIFHWGSVMGIPAAAAREPFSRVLAVEPGNGEAALHLARLAARDGRAGEVDSLVAVMQRADPGGDWTVELGALRAFLSGDRDRQDRAMAVAARQPNRVPTILGHMAAFSYALDAVEEATGTALAADRTPDELAWLELFLAQVRLGRGRYHAALAGLESASALPPARRLEYRAMAATLPFAPLAIDEVARVRDEVGAHPELALDDEGGPVAGPGVEYPHLLWPGLYRPPRLYLLGSLDVRLDRPTTAAAVTDSLAAFHADAALGSHYERILRARAALAAGQPDAGLRALGRAQPPPHRTFESLVDHGRPFERWLRGELLREAGRGAEALRWYGTFPDPIGRDLPYLAPSHLRRAQIHDAAGDREQAALHYRRFIDLWADADPGLQPEVHRARERLSELQRR